MGRSAPRRPRTPPLARTAGSLSSTGTNSAASRMCNRVGSKAVAADREYRAGSNFHPIGRGRDEDPTRMAAKLARYERTAEEASDPHPAKRLGSSTANLAPAEAIASTKEARKDFMSILNRLGGVCIWQHSSRHTSADDADENSLARTSMPTIQTALRKCE